MDAPPPEGPRSVGRAASAPPVILALLAAALWAAWFFATPRLFPLVVSFDSGQGPKTVSEKEVDVSGSLNIPGEVELLVNNIPLHKTETNYSGNFTFPAVRLRPGRNKVDVRARTTKLLRRLRAESSTYYVLRPDPPSAPVLAALPAEINTVPLVISGAAQPGAKVTVSVGTFTSIELTTDDQGRFFGYVGYFEQLPPGVYAVSATARDDSGKVSRPTPEQYVRFDPEGQPPAPPAAKRTLAASLGFKSFTVVVEVALPKDDPRVVSLIRGQSRLQDFIHAVYGRLEVRSIQPYNSPVASLFDHVSPQISTEGDTTVVRATSNKNIQITLPALEGVVTFHTGDDFMSQVNDKLTVELKDYAAVFFDPRPAQWSGNTASWGGGPGGAQGGVAVRVKYDPVRDLSSLSNMLTLTPDDVVAYPANMVFGLLFGMLFMIPIVWVRWILHDEARVLVNEPFDFMLWSLTGYLSCFCFVLPLINLSYAAEYSNSFSLLGGPGGRNLAHVVVPAFVCVLAALASRATLIIVRPARVSFWLWAFLAGLRNSALVTTLVNLTLWGMARSGLVLQDPDHLTALVISPLLFVLFLLPVLLWYKSRGGGYTLKALWPAPILCLLYGLAFTGWGMGAAEDYGVRPDASNFFDFVIWKISNFFGYAQDLVPYILLMCLLLVLSPGGRPPLSERRLVGLGALLFAVYIVGTTASWFMVPIPLLIALLIFPRLVLLPEGRRKAVAGCVGEVIELRASQKLLGRLRATTEAEAYGSHLERLRKKLADGEISVGYYNRRGEEARAWLEVSQREGSLSCGLPASDVVLGVGPRASDWENGLLAAKYGAVVALPLFAVYLGVFVARDWSWVPKSFLLAWLLNRVLIFFMDWLIVGFFYGYFFNYLRGNSGLKKGVFLSAAYVGCLLPVWLISFSSSLPTLVIVIAQNFLFVPLIGLLAFDQRNYRDLWGGDFEWKKFAKFGDMPSLTAFTSVALTALGFVVSSLATGEYKEVLSLLFKTVLPQAGPPSH